MELKTCSKCKESKPLGLFFVKNAAKDGLYSNCKECHKKTCKRWTDENKERKYGKAKEYRQKNPDKIRDLRKVWQKSNPDIMKLIYRKAYLRKSSNLTDDFVVTCLGLTKEKAPKELIEAKRLQLKIHRILKNGDQ